MRSTRGSLDFTAKSAGRKAAGSGASADQSGSLTRSGVPQSCGSSESHRPFGFPRPATATSATPKRELVLANAVGEFDAGERNGRVVERLEASHRGAAPLDRAVLLLDEVVKILVRANFDVSPTRMFAPQQPQRSPTRHVAIQCHLARNARKSRRERFAEERLCGGDATVTAKQEVDRLAVVLRKYSIGQELTPLRDRRRVVP